MNEVYFRPKKNFFKVDLKRDWNNFKTRGRYKAVTKLVCEINKSDLQKNTLPSANDENNFEKKSK